MTPVADILRYIETIAPSYMKEEWDNVGLNCGWSDQPVKKILIALDPFKNVCAEAKEVGADLLITHHALIWKAGFINDFSEQGRNTLFLIQNNIAHINAHTNLDCAPDGVNDQLARRLGLSDIYVIEPKGEDPVGRPYGLLRAGQVPCQSIADFLSTIKTMLGCKGLRYVDSGIPVSKVAVGGGACAGEMAQAVRAGCDTFVTSDVRYNQFWDAKDLGINLIDAGHFHTEDPVCDYLADCLRAAFPEIEVMRSTSHTDCAEFFL